jgi:hypothetical protein
MNNRNGKPHGRVLWAALLIILWLPLINAHSQSQAATDLSALQHALSLKGGGENTAPPVADYPENGALLVKPSASFDGSELTVITSGEDAYYVKLIDPSDQRMILAFFIRPGKTAVVPVPPGVYELRYAAGTVWYGPEHLFGDETYCARDTETMDFTQYTWEVMLYPVPDGNMETEEITRDAF